MYITYSIKEWLLYAVEWLWLHLEWCTASNCSTITMLGFVNIYSCSILFTDVKFNSQNCVHIFVYIEYFLYLCTRFEILQIMNERERIETVMQSLNISARQFAAEIRVQPGTISNMMAGRNNPSLEVMKRIMERYPTLNPEWLIAGRGEMWRSVPGQEAGLFDTLPPDPKEKNTRPAKKEEPQLPAAPLKQITKIVVYYSDNTFEEFSPNPVITKTT